MRIETRPEPLIDELCAPRSTAPRLGHDRFPFVATMLNCTRAETKLPRKELDQFASLERMESRRSFCGMIAG